MKFTTSKEFSGGKGHQLISKITIVIEVTVSVVLTMWPSTLFLRINTHFYYGGVFSIFKLQNICILKGKAKTQLR